MRVLNTKDRTQRPHLLNIDVNRKLHLTEENGGAGVQLFRRTFSNKLAM